MRARAYKDHLVKQPNGRGGTLSIASINKHLAYAVTLFNWSKKQGHFEADNPVSGLKLKSPKRADEERDAFTDSDLKIIFSGDYDSLKHKHPDRFFIPLILLFTGARLGEIAQLGIDDVKEERGVWCFDIHYSEDTSVKTKSSVRLVPIHSFLIDEGLLEYHKKIKAEEHSRLFPLLKNSANGYGSAIGKWFNLRLRRRGITDSKKVLHSLRHSFITSMLDLDVQEHLVSALVGHAVGSMTSGRYGKKNNVKKLKTELEKLSFELSLE